VIHDNGQGGDQAASLKEAKVIIATDLETGSGLMRMICSRVLRFGFCFSRVAKRRVAAETRKFSSFAPI
jgi:hypothetical protein